MRAVSARRWQAKVEVAVLVATRWIIGKLRNRRFSFRSPSSTLCRAACRGCVLRTRGLEPLQPACLDASLPAVPCPAVNRTLAEMAAPLRYRERAARLRTAPRSSPRRHPVDYGELRAGIIHEHALAGRVCLPHDRRQAPLPGAVELTVGVRRPMLFSQQLQRHARPFQLAIDRRPIRQWAPCREIGERN